MKKTICFIAIILLLTGCSGSPNYMPQQTVGEDKNINSSPESEEAWLAFQTILSGDFTLIEDEEMRSSIEWIYEMSFKDGVCEWKYILMDFDKDGRDELFIRLSDENDSGLFRYADDKIECISWDTVEAICFTVPLKDGRLFEEYNTYLYPTKTFTEFDVEKDKTQQVYTYIDVNRFVDMQEAYPELLKAFPMIAEVKNYYFYQEYQNGMPVGDKIEISEDEWQKILDVVDELGIPENEWRDCTDLKSFPK